MILISGIVLLMMALGAWAFFLYWYMKRDTKQGTDTGLLEWMKSAQMQIDSNNRAINSTLLHTSQSISQQLQSQTHSVNQRLENASQQFATFAREVSQLSEIGRSMHELQSLLRSPKMRGNIGEEILKDLIGQMFPKQAFFLQYRFRTGDIVDAAIKTEGGILCIDSKFPMEQFRKLSAIEVEAEKDKAHKLFATDVKKHIKDISTKYIRPDEGTMDFALMYVPAEAVYYEIINLPEIMNFARQLRVYPVSPSTLYAHLQVILLSFEGKKLESKTKELFQLIRTIRLDYEVVESEMSVLARHLGHAHAKLSDVTRLFLGLGGRLRQMTLLEESAKDVTTPRINAGEQPSFEKKE